MRDTAASTPIVVDDALLARLVAALDVPGVVAALLIGSQATGRATATSDVDVAVWLQPDLDAAARFDLRLRLLRAATAAVRSDAVDLVVLDDAPPLFQHRAIRDGRRILDRDRARRIRSETRAVLDYLDTQPLRDELARGLRDRLEAGTFGGRR